MSADQSIRWVGEQHLMRGYCGREVVTGQAVVAEAAPAEAQPATAAPLRPVAVVRPGGLRGRVVRIGPRLAGAPDAHECGSAAAA